MSMGYIPKKKLKARKQRKLRKKYNNFSCASCEKRVCGIPTGIGIAIVGPKENCPNWKKKLDC